MADEKFFLPVRTCSTSWQDTAGIHIRVYTTDGYNVTERCYDGSGPWTNGGFAQEGSNMSVTSWVDGGGTAHIRIYCDYANVTTEWCYDGSGDWYKGDFNYA